ncbi:MAG: 50S ribosomal protein L22 [Gemmatimonadota bacterium]|nr:MAG: 50S ribosomal protein L22 [Gemmatimonadota bacterium]
MEATARAKHMRISPRKMRLVVDLIRGQNVENALVILQGTRKKASPLVEKLLRSAVANALFVGEEEEEGPRMNVDELFVKKVFVDGGPTMKRFRPRSMGRANRIKKRTSHLTIVVGTKKERAASAA